MTASARGSGSNTGLPGCRCRSFAKDGLRALALLSLASALLFLGFLLKHQDLSRLLEEERLRSRDLQREAAASSSARRGVEAAKAQLLQLEAELVQAKVANQELRAQVSKFEEELKHADHPSPPPQAPPAPPSPPCPPQEQLRAVAGSKASTAGNVPFTMEASTLPGGGSYTQVGIAAVADKRYAQRFAVAIASQRCFAETHGYVYTLIDPGDYPTCKQGDFFFRKHCAVARFLEKQEPGYILFVMDGDNPCVVLNRNLDHWLREAALTDVVLYERWMNNEIMAGNYAVRNSKWGIEFCDGWAAFAEEVPKRGFHSSDNGAIHLHVLRVLGLSNLKACTSLWTHMGSDTAQQMDEYFAYVACTRLLMGPPRRWKVAGQYRLTILPRGHAWAIDGGDADSKTSSVGAVSHHGQKTADNYLQYFSKDFVVGPERSCKKMLKTGFTVSPAQYGNALLQKLKGRTDGALLDWTRQHAPPWDWLYLTCMGSLSCRPLDNDEPFSVTMGRPLQSKLAFVRPPKNANWKACAKEWETCNCNGLVFYGVKGTDRVSPLVRTDAGKIECRSETFDGDPAVGDAKHCYCAEGV
eukprot:TRINITY_DN73390_c0_g1_i1.p1 TRINITY_DN73390_c0_g1~~TRINITY_DN73390_c0_g1_i1.p1  ORF type:complete len:583 (+),score=113.05 TRINITY_DN73390_c0_g1_i1:111-1859(+)